MKTDDFEPEAPPAPKVTDADVLEMWSSVMGAMQAQQQTQMKAHAEQYGVEVGQRYCPICHDVRDWCADPCGCVEARKRKEWRAHELQEVRDRIPRGWRWASVQNPAWAKIKRSFASGDRLVRGWKGGSVLLAGPTGIGKTAVEHALIDRLLHDVLEGKGPFDTSWAKGIVVCSAFELAVARRNAPLGREAEIIEEATHASLLVVDECGFEPASPVIFEVVNARYDADAPTILSTGLTVAEFRTRYGAAMLRRIVDRGIMIDAHPAGEVAKP